MYLIIALNLLGFTVTAAMQSIVSNAADASSQGQTMGTLQRSIAAARHGGAVHLIGVLTGGEINPLAILFRTTLLRGVFVGSRDMFESMNKLLTARQIKPVIDRVFDFTDARAALTHLEGASHFGKVVIRIG
jgi:NADPH:quinone reductase-like Zn-dependent oxidoreductase